MSEDKERAKLQRTSMAGMIARICELDMDAAYRVNDFIVEFINMYMNLSQDEINTCSRIGKDIIDELQRKMAGEH